MEKHVKPLLQDNADSQLMGILVAIFAIIITLVLFAIWRRRKSVGQNIILTGLSDSGKTLIYARLISSKFVQTHTSAKENIGDVVINTKTVKIVDIPGDERLHYKFFEKYKLTAKGIVYVIDSVTVQKNIRDVAEYLYNLLSGINEHRNIPVLVLCNKQDQTMAKGCSVIKSLLEKEMNLLRLTKSNQLEATDASSVQVFLGKPGKDFEFDHLNSKVEFAESSAFAEDPETPIQLEQLQAWLQKTA